MVIFYNKLSKKNSGINAPIMEIVKKDKKPFRKTVEGEKGFQLPKRNIQRESCLMPVV